MTKKKKIDDFRIENVDAICKCGYKINWKTERHCEKCIYYTLRLIHDLKYCNRCYFYHLQHRALDDEAKKLDCLFRPY